MATEPRVSGGASKIAERDEVPALARVENEFGWRRHGRLAEPQAPTSAFDQITEKNLLGLADFYRLKLEIRPDC